MQNSGDQGNLVPANMQAIPHPSGQPPAYPAAAVGSQPPASGRPPFAAAPGDAALALRITKLAEYTARNGLAFEAQVRAKQAGSSEYAFLFGGEGSDFYSWCLFCMQRNIPHTLPFPEDGGDTVPAAAAPQALPSQPAPGQHVNSLGHPQAAAPPIQPHPQHAQPIHPPSGAMAPQIQPPLLSSQPAHAPPLVHAAAPLQHQMVPGMSPGMPPPRPAPPVNPGAPGGAINPEVASGFAQVLHVLQGSQVTSLLQCVH